MSSPLPSLESLQWIVTLQAINRPSQRLILELNQQFATLTWPSKQAAWILFAEYVTETLTYEAIQIAFFALDALMAQHSEDLAFVHDDTMQGRKSRRRFVGWIQREMYDDMMHQCMNNTAYKQPELHAFVSKMDHAWTHTYCFVTHDSIDTLHSLYRCI